MKTKSKPDVQTLISMKIPKYALPAIDAAAKGECISRCAWLRRVIMQAVTPRAA